uniref:Chromatin-modifying protein 1a n=1 Tax=Heterosigma akashiwo TaxID=2829 RepID=A0A6V1VCZ1_HETAK|eukprot:CAMPEP_0194714504 /NCGR_PEP_ID=MMETSP0296-20130528/6107_1 /TAXON_ID=39354 /ORGANISM="Heterosigma akashiwo, Strain CCMP2393" /LENGTH=190 /DNA_ID=CAMNT_0039613659 /DNA_START=76 /DNA_END=648 /DNA_ORIENTATION=-
MKLTSKQLKRDSAKALKSSEADKIKVKKAIQAGNMDGARIYAENSIRNKNQSLKYLQLSSRIDAVAARLETAVRTQALSKSMGRVVTGMGSAMKNMNVERISATMDEFEKQFEDLDVRAAYMEDAISGATAISTPEDDVNALIQLVADENQLELGDQLADAGAVGTTVAAPEEKVAETDDLAARLAALRK